MCFSGDCLCCRDLTSELVDYQVVGHVGGGRCSDFFSVVEINDPDKRQCRGEEAYCGLQFQRDRGRPGNRQGRHAGKNQKPADHTAPEHRIRENSTWAGL